MLRPEFQPNFLNEQDCKENATRQLLSFITLPSTEAETPPPLETATDEVFFPYDALTDEAFTSGPELFNWKSRDIYDVDGLLLFRDMTLDLGSGREWHVRTAASDLLQTQVLCMCDHQAPALSDKAQIENALRELRRYPDLEPFIVDEKENVRLVAYSNPNLGILCYSRKYPAARFVSKLGEPLIIQVKPYEPPAHPESLLSVWSPYDTVERHTIARLRQLWEENMARLPLLPKNREELQGAIRKAHVPGIVEHMVKPPLKLIAQQSEKSCAVASALMLLTHHGISLERLGQLNPPVRYQDIAHRMKCDINNGALPEAQLTEINRLLDLVGSNLEAVLDRDPTFDEAREELVADRPVKFGVPGHARAVAGFRAEPGDRNWLWLYDPLPPNQGEICLVPWTEGTNQDFIYVKPL
jgi:hypothetical protein